MEKTAANQAAQGDTSGRKAAHYLRLAAGGILWLLGKGVQLAGRGIAAGAKALAKRRSKTMNLRSAFFGAAALAGALMGPGLYYMTQEHEIIRTRVTGKMEADLKAEFPGQKYFVYSKEGKFDTYALPNGRDIREGCVYDFNVKSARLQWWPPSYSRSITSYKTVSCPGQ